MRRSSTKWRGLVILAGVLIVAGLLLGACGSSSTDSSSPAAQSSPKAGGTYNYPLGADPVAIDPLTSYENMGMQVVHQVFQGLVQSTVDDKGNVGAAPCIAESWDTTDNQTWTFHLKKGVTFAAPVSREVKAQDFVDSWNYVTDEKNASPVSYILAPIEGCESSGYQTDAKKGLTGVTAIDDYTLEVKLQYPFADFVLSLLHPVSSAQPVDYIKQVGAKTFALQPVGTGPYMMTAPWQHKRLIDLVKNPDYWDTANAGYVDAIHMPIITSTQTEWLEFQKGALDYSNVPPGQVRACLLYTSPSPRDRQKSRMPSSA